MAAAAGGVHPGPGRGLPPAGGPPWLERGPLHPPSLLRETEGGTVLL